MRSWILTLPLVVWSMGVSASFLVQLEEDVDSAVDEVFYATFDSFTDLVVGNLGLSISGMGVPASMSTTGLAFDGEQYIVQFEEDVDSAVDEVFYATFDSFADLLVGNLGLSISGMGVPASMSTTGLAFDGEQYIVQFEEDVDSAVD